MFTSSSLPDTNTASSWLCQQLTAKGRGGGTQVSILERQIVSSVVWCSGTMATPIEQLTEKQQQKIRVQLVRERLLQQIFKEHPVSWEHEPILMRFYGKYMPKKGKNRFGSIYVTPNYIFFTNATIKSAAKETSSNTKILKKLAESDSESDSDLSAVESEDLEFMLTVDLESELPISRRSSTEVDVVIPIQRLATVPELIRHHTVTHSVLDLTLTTGMAHRLLILWLVPDSAAVSKKQPAKFRAFVRYLWLHPVLYVRVQQPTDEEWRAEQEQHLRRAADSETDLVMPDVRIMEEMISKAEGLLERNVELRSLLQHQAEAIDRIDGHIDTVANGLKSIKAELSSLESVTGHFKKMATDVDLLLKSRAKKSKPDRTLPIPSGERFLVPVLFREEKRLYQQAVMVFDDDEFFLAYPMGAIPKKAGKNAEKSGNFVIIDGQRCKYADIVHVTVPCRHQHLKFRTMDSRTITVFSSYVQHIVNELKIRSKHDFRIIFHPNVRIFELGHDEIRQVPVNVSGEDDGSGDRDAIHTVRAKINLYDPIFQFQSLEQKLGAEAQSSGAQKISEIMALLLEDSQIIQQELLRQTGQLQVQNEAAQRQLSEAHRVSHRIRRVA